MCFWADSSLALAAKSYSEVRLLLARAQRAALRLKTHDFFKRRASSRTVNP